jgi:hypothetical protein
MKKQVKLGKKKKENTIVYFKKLPNNAEISAALYKLRIY